MILDEIRKMKNEGKLTLRKSYPGSCSVQMKIHNSTHVDIILYYPNNITPRFLISIWNDGDFSIWHWSIGGTLIGLRRYYNRERQLYDIDGKYIKDIKT